MKKIPKQKICINLTLCKSKIIYKISQERDWSIIDDDINNTNCDIIYTNLQENFNIFKKLKSY